MDANEQDRRKEIDHQWILLDQYRRNLRHLKRQAAAYGGNELAPPVTVNSINATITNILQIKAALRAYGATVEDEENEDTYI